jgi:hypothetical protein
VEQYNKLKDDLAKVLSANTPIAGFVWEPKLSVRKINAIAGSPSLTLRFLCAVGTVQEIG